MALILNSTVLAWAINNGFKREDILTLSGREKIQAAYDLAHPSADGSKVERETHARYVLRIVDGVPALLGGELFEDSSAARMAAVLDSMDHPTATYKILTDSAEMTAEECGTENRGRKAKVQPTEDSGK